MRRVLQIAVLVIALVSLIIACAPTATPSYNFLTTTPTVKPEPIRWQDAQNGNVCYIWGSAISCVKGDR